MSNSKQLLMALGFGASTLVVGACGGHDRSASTTAGGDVGTPSAAAPASTTTPTTAAAPADSTHHSKLAGAALGAVAGHMLGGHAVAGAAAGALIQHERNKHR